MKWKGSKLLRHFLQFLCLLMAWFTAMTRISNYKHHWSDVLAGSTLGIVSALVMVSIISLNFYKDNIGILIIRNNFEIFYNFILSLKINLFQIKILYRDN